MNGNSIDFETEKNIDEDIIDFERPVKAKKPVVSSDVIQLKKGIWIYFFLIIFEGALRKWVLPGLATPLLLIRDPVALWLLVKSMRGGLLPANIYLKAMVIVCIIAIFTTLFWGHGNLAVTLFGARILILHFPLIFVIGNIFDRRDVENMGKAIVFITIPMAILTALQFYSPQGAWVNRGIGGDENGAGFSGAMGYFRPSGTFSFTNGNSLFFSLAASFILFFWLDPKKINKIILIAATLGLLSAIPLSISRALLFSCIVSVVFAIIGMFRNPKFLGRLALIGIVGFVSVAVLSQTKFFHTSMEAFTDRFNTASEAEGGTSGVIGDRYIGGMVSSILGINNVPFFGFGMGMGTNVGAMLLSGKNTTFLIAEGEWGRLIGESGALIGIVIIFIRLALVAKMAVLSFKKINSGDLLPWMLLSFGALNIPQGQWAQPTGLGFSVLVGGLIIASFRNSTLE
jgi:hypothetical protein